MCHPWLAAGVTGFVGVLLFRELRPVLSEQRSGEPNRDHGLLGARLRRWFRNRIAPLVDAALAMGLTADGATMLQLATSVACGMAYGHGWLFTAGWILITSGTLDVLDGEMARRERRDGPRGAFIDSVVDRYGESAVFAGMVVYYRDDWVLWAVLAAWAGSFLVSYARARAESLGIECREGMLQRPERYVLLGGASMIGTVVRHLFCSVPARDVVMAVGISTLAVLANATAFQRMRSAVRRLG